MILFNQIEYMAMLEFVVDGQKVISRNLRVLADGIKDMTSEMRQIGELVRSSALDNMEKQGSEGGGSWKWLAPKTQRMREKRQGYYKNGPWAWAGKTGPILQWTGRLKAAFRTDPLKDQVTIDNPTPYFKWHQAQDRKSAKLPRRLILELKQSDKIKTLNIIAKGLNAKLEGGTSGKQF